MRRGIRAALWLAIVLAVLAALPALWARTVSEGHRFAVPDAPSAPVAIVFGAELAPGGTQPKPFLAGRLDVAADLYRAGKVTSVLVSGDARGTSGDEVGAMERYLEARGVPGDRIAEDGLGLDSYDTCLRARDVYGLRRVLLVSQNFHLVRAVTLCRQLGVDADGVNARCDNCRTSTLVKNRARDFVACHKAVYDLWSHRPAGTG
ncbi:membrane protein [Longispora fulva]|uniref:Vancomycin permeability regulator SanA n=1 Tax=Longispora fulva TaxID=619741 RepID=A0A8J7GKJ3_9ACTN|nr:ElyC/SanA/YdcF family protein [Longispora fulva]MBG6138532.1 vancomycin permeability regulator SanA [Longispora fulva]GIG62362.1 membrane protein [Longispora fulva]